MSFCPHCNEYISNSFCDYSYSDSTYSDDYSMDEAMEDFGHVPISKGLKRTRAEANLEEMSRPGTKKRRLESSSWSIKPMEVDQ